MISSLALFVLATLAFQCAAAAQGAGAPPPCRGADCCAMREGELRSCAAFSERCASDQAATTGLAPRSCADCPAGECRVGDTCVCTLAFLDSPRKRESCRRSHGAVWGRAAGALDNTRRHCPGQKGVRTIPAACRRRACCEMRMKDLERCDAHSDRCLQRKATEFLNANYCVDCPFGECRLDRRCVCTLAFLQSPSMRVSCRRSHGGPWPVPSRATDAFRRNCTKVEGPVKAQKPAKVSPPAKVSSSPSDSKGKKAQNAQSAPDTPVPSAAAVQERKLSGGEVAGIVFGAIGALAGVVGVLVALFKRNEIIDVISPSRGTTWNHPADK